MTKLEPRIFDGWIKVHGSATIQWLRLKTIRSNIESSKENKRKHSEREELEGITAENGQDKKKSEIRNDVGYHTYLHMV